MATLDGAGGGTGSARRRSERRLRSWWRHERMLVAAVLATANHHPFNKVGTAYGAPRSQKPATRTDGESAGTAPYSKTFISTRNKSFQIIPCTTLKKNLKCVVGWLVGWLVG